LNQPARFEGKIRAIHGLQARTVVLVALGAIVPVAIGGGFAAVALRELEQTIISERRSEALRTAKQLDDSLSLVAEGLLEIAEAGPAGKSASGPAERLLFRTGFITGIDQEIEETSPMRKDSTDRPRARRETAGHQILFSIPLTRDPQSSQRRLGARIDPSSRAFQNLLRSDLSQTPGSVDWIGADGSVLASTDPSRMTAHGRHNPHGARFAVLRDTRRAEAGSCRSCHGAAKFSGENEIVALAPTSITAGGISIRAPESDLLSPVRTLRTRLIVLIPILAAGVVLFSTGAALSLRRPLAQLRRSAERIAAGDLTSPIPSLAEDEVGRLGRALEKMRQALADSIAGVERANAALETRVDERTRELRQLSSQLEEQSARRAQVLARLISAQEDERKRIARELHDETCQSVSALLLAVEGALARGIVLHDRTKLDEIRALASHTLDELHRLIFDLRPSLLDDLGLQAALEWWANRNLAPAGITARFEIEGFDERLPGSVEITSYRAIQEALANVLRHSHAEAVLIQVERAGGKLAVEIEDDGAGFDPAAFARPREDGQGLGLAGMRERIEILGGTIRIDSAPGKGCLVRFEIPLEGKASR